MKDKIHDIIGISAIVLMIAGGLGATVGTICGIWSVGASYYLCFNISMTCMMVLLAGFGIGYINAAICE